MLLTNCFQADIALLVLELCSLLALGLQYYGGIQPIPIALDPLFIESIQDGFILVNTHVHVCSVYRR